VPVLAVEFGQHLLQAGRLRFDVNHVSRYVTAVPFDPARKIVVAIV
jgi:hypothetical protein